MKTIQSLHILTLYLIDVEYVQIMNLTPATPVLESWEML